MDACRGCAGTAPLDRGTIIVSPRPTTVMRSEDTSGNIWCSEFEAGATAPIRSWVERSDRIDEPYWITGAMRIANGRYV